jgi:hypothetical protein
MTTSRRDYKSTTPNPIDPRTKAILRTLRVNINDKAATFSIGYSEVVESEEVAPGVIVHYGTDGEPTQIELIQIDDVQLSVL